MTKDIRPYGSKSERSMHKVTKRIGTFISASVVAALLFTGSASASSLSLSFGFGSGGVSVHSGSHPHSNGNYFGRSITHHDACMNNAGVKQYLRNQGFRDVRYVNEGYRNKARFSALWNGWRYSMLVDRCTGEITSVERAQPFGHDLHPHGTPDSPFSIFGNDFPFGGFRDYPYHTH